MRETDPGGRTATPERYLWGAVLAQLLEDALKHWKGRNDPDGELEQAFDDVLRVGPMLRRCCDHTGHDAEWIAGAFVYWVEQEGYTAKRPA